MQKAFLHYYCNMIKYTLILGFMVLMACSNSKETLSGNEETDQTTEEVESVTENYRVIGIVHISETDCPLLIETRLKEETVLFYPLNLDEKFRREGMKIKFAYETSKGSLPENCSEAVAVSLSDVTLMR